MSMLLLLLGMAQATSAPVTAEASRQERQLLQDCSAHRFETIVSAVVDGQIKRSRVKMCGTPGQTDEGWIATLRDSAAKITANEGVAKPMRDEMAKAVNAEIARLSSGSAAASPSSSGSFTLKPRQGPGTASKESAKPAYTSLPPLPPPVVVKAVPGAYVAPPPIIRPDLNFECFSTGTGSGEGPCIEFDRFTVIVAQAKSAVGPGASLRFFRDGEEQGEVALGPLRKGQRQRIALPAKVCKGVVGGELKIETMVVPQSTKTGARVAGSQGPYNLRC